MSILKSLLSLFNLKAINEEKKEGVQSNTINQDMNSITPDIKSFEYDSTIELTMRETFVYLLFANKTLQEIKRLSLNKINRYGFDFNDISFRIEKSKKGYYNLELMMADDLGIYFKPIGYYVQDKNGNVTEIYLINEFIKDFNDISYLLDNTNLFCELKLIDNVFIALASREVYQVVRSLFNSNEFNHFNIADSQYKVIIVNDLKIIVKTSLMGALEALYDDEYDLFREDLLVMFKKSNNGITIHCTDKEYKDLTNRGLLSVFN